MAIYSLLKLLHGYRFSPNTLRAGLRYIHTSISAEKTALFGCLTNAIAPPLIALESYSRAQMDRLV